MSDKSQIIRTAFLKAVFSLLGYVAYCDGPINRHEIKRIKIHMKKMNLSELDQRKALYLFKSGTRPEFNASQTIKEFRQTTTPKLVQILLVHLITMARADGGLVKKEMHAILWLARELGYKSIVFNHLLRMIYTQDQIARRNNPTLDNQSGPRTEFNHSSAGAQQQTYDAAGKTHNHTGKNHSHTQANYQSAELQNAYTILGVTADMTEEEIRKTYKKLASQFHPDKLAGQGLAQEQLHAATERFKKILAAYEFIKQHRSIYSAPVS